MDLPDEIISLVGAKCSVSELFRLIKAHDGQKNTERIVLDLIFDLISRENPQRSWHLLESWDSDRQDSNEKQYTYISTCIAHDELSALSKFLNDPKCMESLFRDYSYDDNEYSPAYFPPVIYSDLGFTNESEKYQAIENGTYISLAVRWLIDTYGVQELYSRMSDDKYNYRKLIIVNDLTSILSNKIW